MEQTLSNRRASDAAPPTFGELVATFAKIGIISFGGAPGQIAMMHRIVVDDKKWLDEERYIHALNYCTLLPGPEAQQLATYIGWLTHGVKGGLAAGLLFVLPGAAFMLGLSYLYVLGSGFTVIDGLFFGIKAAVLAIVVHALLKIAKRGLKSAPYYTLAALALAAILFLDLPFPLIVIGAALTGAALTPASAAQPSDSQTPLTSAQFGGAFLAALACLAAWWAPVLIAVLLLGPDHVLVEIGLFFSKLAVVTFGGAYAVLAYLAQAGVDKGWVKAAEMIDGLGLAETTPGPTILVNQFVAFLAGFRRAAPFSPLTGATLGASMAVWVTFTPSFLWIFAGAPFVERLRHNKRLAGALSGITAAVVGVIAYITLWFSLNVLFREAGKGQAGFFHYVWVRPDSLDSAAVLLSLLAFALMFLFHRGVMTTVGVLAILGVGLRLVVPA